jgi:type III secretion protein J
MKDRILLFIILLSTFVLTSCGSGQPIVNQVTEHEANEIVVLLASKNIKAEKIQAPATGVGGMAGGSMMWNIHVPMQQSTEAMSILNQYGLPRKQGTNLLELFAKQGLMSSDKEEAIRFQAGLAEQLSNTVRKMDGVIDANVQLSFPQEETTPGEKPPKITAAVYVKHMGVFDDPNSQLETKIKRLISGSVTDLAYDNVAIITDRARIADVGLFSKGEPVSMKEQRKTMVKIWSMVMTKDSLGKFRTLFFIMILLVMIFGSAALYLAIKNYPALMQKIPFTKKRKKNE